jgi:hypothetical protein
MSASPPVAGAGELGAAAASPPRVRKGADWTSVYRQADTAAAAEAQEASRAEEEAKEAAAAAGAFAGGCSHDHEAVRPKGMEEGGCLFVSRAGPREPPSPTPRDNRGTGHGGEH